MATTKEQAAQLARENEALKAKISLLEAAQTPPEQQFAGSGIAEEMRKIRAKGKSQANVITVTEKNDHVNVTLWTPWGKPIGPLHPENAIQTLERWGTLLGVNLSVNKPTNEQQIAFQKTATWAKMQKAWEKKESWRVKSRRSGQMEKLIAEIAKSSGITAAALNNVLKPGDVRPLAEVRQS